MDISSFHSFLEENSKYLYVPIIGVGLSTFTNYSLLTNQNVIRGFGVALASCLLAAALIFTIHFFLNSIENIFVKKFKIRLSWLIGVTLMAMFMSRLTIKYTEYSSMGNAHVFNPCFLFRSASLLLITLVFLFFEKKQTKVNRIDRPK
jgi:hypothetical protein